jgi:phospholipid/cholesterol/gamma-HCH transport system permease protein
MKNNLTTEYRLPESISRENVTDLFGEIKDLYKHGPPILDFSRVSTIDAFGMALIGHLKKNDPDLVMVNMKSEIGHLLKSAVLENYSDREERNKRFDGHILTYILHKYRRMMDHLKSYAVLLADELTHTFVYLLKRRGIFPGEIGSQLFQMGYDSFPIVCLISFLIGVTISITSLEQLHQIGADIYLANLVGFGMIRELVPLMTGIILAGKIGASITAEIASMKVLEEVDALTTMAINPQKYLMVPRLLAITVAIPLLVGMADLVGIIGGVLVGHFFSDIPGNLFFDEIFKTVTLGDFLVGLLKTMVFGWMVVFTAGYKGFSVGKGAEGVGLATTQSVVLSISLIIVLDCIFALILY